MAETSDIRRRALRIEQDPNQMMAAPAPDDAYELPTLTHGHVASVMEIARQLTTITVAAGDVMQSI